MCVVIFVCVSHLRMHAMCVHCSRIVFALTCCTDDLNLCEVKICCVLPCVSWRQAYVQLEDTSPVRGKELLGSEKLTVEDAKQRHLTLKPKLRARLFGSVKFGPDEGYVSYQA